MWKTVTQLSICGSLLFASAVFAADSDWEMEPFKTDLKDTAALQRGAKLYTNFCLGCHTLQYQRYERTADDLGSIPHELFVANLIFTEQKIGEHMVNAMDPDKASKWFGAVPPDLTMVTRVRSPEWVYNFLKTFYEDPSRPLGVNNKVFPNVGMPHVLLMLQGVNEEVCEGNQAVDFLGGIHAVNAPRKQNCYELSVKPGTGLLTVEEFDQVASDIANFLHYVGDPTRQEREALGVWVLAFLAVLFVLAWFLNRNYWQDIAKAPPRSRHDDA